jgi:integrase
VFPSAAARTLRDPSNTAHHIRDLLNDAGFPWATAHTFRKTAGTLLTDAGVSLREVANQLGHARVSTTLDYYQGRGTVTRQAASVL